MRRRLNCGDSQNTNKAQPRLNHWLAFCWLMSPSIPRMSLPNPNRLSSRLIVWTVHKIIIGVYHKQSPFKTTGNTNFISGNFVLSIINFTRRTAKVNHSCCLSSEMGGFEW